MSCHLRSSVWIPAGSDRERREVLDLRVCQAEADLVKVLGLSVVDQVLNGRLWDLRGFTRGVRSRSRGGRCGGLRDGRQRNMDRELNRPHTAHTPSTRSAKSTQASSYTRVLTGTRFSIFARQLKGLAEGKRKSALREEASSPPFARSPARREVGRVPHRRGTNSPSDATHFPTREQTEVRRS